MRRRMALSSLIAAALVVATLSRCDRREPGEAAEPEADVRLGGGIVRRDVRFPCGDSKCAAWLYLPAASDSPPPVVVLAHGFAGTRDVGLAPLAERLAGAGFAALVFDYRFFGASGGLPRQVVDPQAQLEDWRAALRFARAIPDVDGGRLAVLGSSLGGGHALVIAAEDPAVRAVVAQAPLIDSSMEGDATFFGVGWAARLLLTAWSDMALSSVGRAPLLLPAIAPSGGFGMIADDAAYAAFEKVVAPESRYRNAVAARSIFLFDDYDPSRRAREIRVPVLLIASRSDRFAPYAAVEALAKDAPQVEVASFDGDHFDVYVPPASDQASAAAIDFLARHLR